MLRVVGRVGVRFAGVPAELVEDVAGFVGEAGEAAIHEPKSVVHDDFLVRACSVTQSLTSEVSQRLLRPTLIGAGNRPVCTQAWMVDLQTPRRRATERTFSRVGPARVL